MGWKEFLKHRDKTLPPGKRPDPPTMPQPKKYNGLDPAKRFQCEMAERIFYSLNGCNKNNEEITYNTRLSNTIARDIYNHFFE